MRFAQAHKASSYLMLASAFIAMVAGGGISPVIALFGVIGLVGSWWWEAPRVRLDRWANAWTVCSVLVLVGTTSVAVTSGDWFGAGASFLVWLIVAKAFNRKTSKDWQQLHLLSFLMLVAGSVLAPGLTYAFAFLAFVVSSTWALILSHLRREMEDNFLLKHADAAASERVEVQRILASRRIVDRRFFAGTGAVSLGVVVASLVLFLSIPRVGAGFFMKKKEGLTFAGFSEKVKLGGHGTIKGDPTIVMRIEVPAPYGGRGAPYIHWRGVAFDQYANGEWRRSRRAPHTITIDEPVPSGERRHVFHAGDDRATTDVDVLDARLAGAVRQTIYRETISTDVLFGASTPSAFEYTPRPGREGRIERNDELRLDHDGPLRYSVWSVIEPPDPGLLRQARPVPASMRIFTQLPPEITPRTRTLAAEITAGASTQYDRVVAIETWLRDNLTYTLDLEEPGAQEPVDFFLFDRKRGHCEYFASAFAVLARAVGIPTRQVNGFLGGEWNEYDDFIAVRAGDAHSWDEVYFENVGWVTFDATPASQDRLGRGGNAFSDRVRRFFDSLRFQWSKWVVEYDLARQIGLFKDVGGGLKGVGKWLSARGRSAKRWARDHVAITAVLGAAVIALIGWRLWRRRKGGAGPVEPRARPRPKSPIATLYARVLARLARRGVARAPGVTPRELAREVAARGLPYAGALTELTEIYYAVLWGGDTGPELDGRAHALASEIELAVSR